MYSEDFRKKVLESRLEKGYSYKKLADKFDVSVQFISDLINYNKRTGKIINEDLGKKSVDFKLSGKYEEVLLKLIKEKPSITLIEISNYFKEKHNFSVGKSSVDRKLKSLGISLKKKGTTIQRKIPKSIK